MTEGRGNLRKATVDMFLCPPLKGGKILKQLLIISLPFILPHPFKYKEIVRNAEKLFPNNHPKTKSPFTNASQRFEKFRSANKQLPISSNVPMRFKFRKNKALVNLDISEAGHGVLSLSFVPGANPKQAPIQKQLVNTIDDLKQIRNTSKKMLKNSLKEITPKIKINPFTDDIFIFLFYFCTPKEIKTFHQHAKKLITKYTGNYREVMTETGEIHLFSKKMLIMLSEITSRDAKRNFTSSVFHGSTLAYCTHILAVNFLNATQTNMPIEDWTKPLVSLNPFIISGRNRTSFNSLNGIARHAFIKTAMQHHCFEKFRSAMLDAVLLPDALDYPDLLKFAFILYRLPLFKPALNPFLVKDPKYDSTGVTHKIIDHLKKRMSIYLEFITRHPHANLIRQEDEQNELKLLFPLAPELQLRRLRSYMGGDIISNICNALGLRREIHHKEVRDSLSQLMKAGIVIGKHLKRPGIHKNNLVYFINVNENELRMWIAETIEKLFPMDIATE